MFLAVKWLFCHGKRKCLNTQCTIAKNLGHSTEIVTVDNYIDKSKLSVIKLDKLDSFIDSVVPKTNCEEEDKDFSKVIIDVSEFF